MTASKGLGTYGNAVGVVTPADHKLALSGLLTKTSGNAIRPGLFWGGNANIIVGKANMSYDVIAFTGALSRGASSGTTLGANDGTLNVTTTAAPGSNSRIDIIYWWQREYSLDGTDSNPVIGVVQGTAAASPTAPSLAAFPGALEIGRATVGAGITATTSATITQTAPFTAVDGGVVMFRTKTEMVAVTSMPKWSKGTVLADGIGWTFDGTDWGAGVPTNLQLDTTNSVVRAITQIGIGKITGSGTTNATEVVTFPIAFRSGSVPVVVSSSVGTRATGAFNALGLSASGLVLANSYGVSTTGFTLRLDTTGVLGGTTDFYYSWTATGTV